MAQRIPLDVQFLLESLTGQPITNSATPIDGALNENPDGVAGGVIDAITGHPDKLGWRDGGYTFYAAKTYNIIGKSDFGSTHGDVISHARKIFYNGRYNAAPLTDNGFNVSDEREFFIDLFDDGGSMNTYFANNEDDFGEDEPIYRTKIDRMLVGRVWPEHKIISFWNEQRDVIKLWANVRKMFVDNTKALGDLRSYKIDWVEREESSDPFASAGTLEGPEQKTGNEPEVNGQMNFFEKIFNTPVLLDRLSSAKLKQIRNKVHVMEPELKAQIMKANHGALVNKGAEIADKLGMSVAEFRSLWSLDENTLNEDPDNVDTNDDNLHYNDDDTVAFFCTKNYSIIAPRKTHWEIMEEIRKIRLNQTSEKFQDEEMVVSNDYELEKDIFDTDSNLHKFLDKPKGNFRSDISGFISGRLWTASKTISFWNNQIDVLNNWEAVEQMFNDHSRRIGILDKYNVDFIERDSSEIPLTPAKSISKPKNNVKVGSDRFATEPTLDTTDYENLPTIDADKQLNFFDKIFRNPILLDKLSSAQLKKIQNKIHVMPPELKAQIMKANQSSIVNKAGEIADKLGMSVAEFHSLWGMDENKLNESPDWFDLRRGQIKVLLSKGIETANNVGGNHVWSHKAAIPFIFDLNNKLTLYGVGDDNFKAVHPDMGTQVMAYNKSPNKFKKFPSKKYKGYGFDLADDAEAIPGQNMSPIYILQAKTLPELANGLRKMSRTIPLDGDIPRKRKDFIQGRLWVDVNAVSFWSTRESVMRNFAMVEELLTGLNIQKEKAMYEFIDSKHIFTYDELTGKSVETRSKEEMDKLMAMQHIDPKAKKKLAMMQGNLKQKGDVGWDFQAQKHAAMPALEESPDRVEVEPDNRSELESVGLDPRKMNGSHWKDSDAITFILDTADKRGLWIAADQVVIGNEQYAHRPNHAAMMRQIAYFRQYPSEFEIKSFGGEPVLVSKPDANRLKVWIVKGGVHGVDFSGSEDFSAYLAMADWSKLVQRKTLPESLILGRYWRNSKVISFWQKKELVLQNFKLIEDFLKQFSTGREEVGYEFIDVKKVFAHTELFKKDDDQLKRGSEEIADLVKKQHTDASAKKKLKDMGYYDTATDRKKLGGFDTMAQKHSARPALQETPDKGSFSPEQAIKLKNAGFDVKSMYGSSWGDVDSVCAILDSYNKKIVWSNRVELGTGATHGNIVSKINFAKKYRALVDIKNDGSKYSISFRGENMEKNNFTLNGIGFLNERAFQDYILSREWDYDIRDEDDIIAFRYWKNTKFISFWEPKSDVMREFRLIEKFLSELGERPTNVAYQFIDQEKVYLYDELLKNDNAKPLSPEEIQKLQKIQHLDPEAKKKLAANAGLNQKISPGFDFQAKAQAMMPALQEIVKKFNIAK